MNELHMSVIREINGKHIMADVELPYDDLENFKPDTQGKILYETLQKIKDSLDEAEVDQALANIKDLKVK